MGRLFLADCVPGDLLEDVFCVCGRQLSADRTGTPFIKLQVSDRSGQINARKWKATRADFDGIPENGFLRIRGKIENYQTNLQLIIDTFWSPKDGTFDLAELLPHTEKDIPTMCAKVCELMGSIQNRHLAALVSTYIEDGKLMEDFCRAPAAQSFHHAYIGGLLEHTLNALEVADAIIRFYPGLNRDLVLAGIFLHDIAKTWELRYESAFSYSDGGQLVGHIFKSAMWVEHKAREAEQVLGEPLPHELIDVMQHIILSHHGTPEFGAAKVPSTPEALAVHHIENMDAKLMTALAATRGPKQGCEGNWTDYLKSFGGRLYRPDVAPSEVVETAPADGDGAVKPSLDGRAMMITNPLFETAVSKRG